MRVCAREGELRCRRHRSSSCAGDEQRDGAIEVCAHAVVRITIRSKRRIRCGEYASDAYTFTARAMISISSSRRIRGSFTSLRSRPTDIY
jgi:hypothetical protein